MIVTITGDPLLDLFILGIIALAILLLIIGGVSEIIKTVLNKLIFHNKKYK